MGIFTTLLTLPISGPLKGVFWLAETLTEQAEGELYNPEKIRAQMTDLELRLDMGEISEEEYNAAEELLLARLKEARQRMTAR
ncbi:MAG: gas vesicle protein GvpG [Chloroflexaceae bacterium]|jgi:hypothetical protein|nr:gas vesicle protein GvpG [Chloroflexaceae bacterium]